MSYKSVLPFAEKSTYKDGSSLTLTSTIASTLWGRVYDTNDSNNRPRQVRIVHLKSAVTAAKVVLEFDSDEGDTGRQITAICDTEGAKGKPLTDQIPADTVLAANDLVCVIESGFCECTAGAAFDAGADLMSNATGKLIAATAGKAIIARAEEAATGADEVVGVYVYPGIPKTNP